MFVEAVDVPEGFSDGDLLPPADEYNLDFLGQDWDGSRATNVFANILN